MKYRRYFREIFRFILPTCLIFSAVVSYAEAQNSNPEKLLYHDIQTDESGTILPWYDKDLGASYDHVINLVWNFWDKMQTDPNGLPYYMNHQVWKPDFDDPRGIGGDQFQMAMSSWQLYYAYSGNERVKQNIRFLADYYLSHSLSPENCQWPNLPFPYNTLVYSGVYDGDMVTGHNFLQPDKAGSFALELVHLYKMTTSDQFHHATYNRYLDAAKKIATTLIQHLGPGDENSSPLPFRVNALTGEIGQFEMGDKQIAIHNYTTNWAPTMELFLELQKLDPANADIYLQSFNVLLRWMKTFPLKTNKWGPFFEDVPGNSDTQINAITFARFILEHRELFPNWQSDARGIFTWAYLALGNNTWSKYGVNVVNEQTSYPIPGESHVSREGATEVLYSVLSGDKSLLTNAIRELSWATYSVDFDGKNRFPQDGHWLTDGYGDYVRHYIRAMAAMPRLAPYANHILSSTSIIQTSNYNGNGNKYNIPEGDSHDAKIAVFYRTFDENGTEVVRMTDRPSAILLDGKPMIEDSKAVAGYTWKPLARGGALQIRRVGGYEVQILK